MGGGETYGDNDECPLLGELRALNLCRFDTYVFIDDARLFLSPPPLPHQCEQWPDIQTVIDALSPEINSKYVAVMEDVVVAVPQFAKSIVVKYSQDANARLENDYQRLKGNEGLLQFLNRWVRRKAQLCDFVEL